MKKNKSAIVYIRVSSGQQVENTSLDMQEEQCRDWCKRNGYTVAGIFREEGESAKTTERPQLMAAMESAKQLKPGIWLFWKVDRQARNSYDYYWLRYKLNRLGVKVRSVTEQFDDTPAGQLMEGLLVAFAQYDNQLRAERTRRGMTELAKDGWWLWAAPYGYKCAKDGGKPSLEIVDADAVVVRKMFEMVTRSFTGHEICARFPTVFPKTINKVSRLFKMLRNPAYAALLKTRLLKEQFTPGKWPAIIEPELYWQVQKILDTENVPVKRRAVQNDFPLRGVVFCEHCNVKMTSYYASSKSGKKYGYYECYKCRTRVRKSVMEQQYMDIIAAMRVDPLSLSYYRKLIVGQFAEMEKAQRQVHRDIKARVDKTERRKDRLFDLYLDGAVDKETYDAKSKALAMEIANAKMEVTDASADKIDLQAAVEYAVELFENPVKWHENANKQQIELFRAEVFGGILTYDGTTLRTPINNNAANSLCLFGGVESNLVAPESDTSKFLTALLRVMDLLLKAG